MGIVSNLHREDCESKNLENFIWYKKKKVWFVTAILSGFAENRMLQATRTQQLNWRGYGLELTVLITEKGLSGIPETGKNF